MPVQISTRPGDQARRGAAAWTQTPGWPSRSSAGTTTGGRALRAPAALAVPLGLHEPWYCQAEHHERTVLVRTKPVQYANQTYLWHTKFCAWCRNARRWGYRCVIDDESLLLPVNRPMEARQVGIRLPAQATTGAASTCTNSRLLPAWDRTASTRVDVGLTRPSATPTGSHAPTYRSRHLPAAPKRPT